jgi:hypothetical protein
LDAAVGAAVKPLRGKVKLRLSIHRTRVEQLRRRLEHEADENHRQVIQAQLVGFHRDR